MNTTLVIFAVVAAFGLAAATFVVPMVPQAQGQGQGCEAKSAACKAFGLSKRPLNPGPP